MEMCASEVGLLEIGAFGLRAVKISRKQIGVTEIRPAHISSAKIGRDKDCATQIEVGET